MEPSATAFTFYHVVVILWSLTKTINFNNQMTLHCTLVVVTFLLLFGGCDTGEETGDALMVVIQVRLVVVVESPLFHSKASVDKHWLSFLSLSHRSFSVHTDPCLQKKN